MGYGIELGVAGREQDIPQQTKETREIQYAKK